MENQKEKMGTKKFDLRKYDYKELCKEMKPKLERLLRKEGIGNCVEIKITNREQYKMEVMAITDQFNIWSGEFNLVDPEKHNASVRIINSSTIATSKVLTNLRDNYRKTGLTEAEIDVECQEFFQRVITCETKESQGRMTKEVEEINILRDQIAELRKKLQEKMRGL